MSDLGMYLRVGILLAASSTFLESIILLSICDTNSWQNAASSGYLRKQSINDPINSYIFLSSNYALTSFV